ncbi:MAG TPA: TIGR02301 family protein [Hyphomicrobiaceae bacterium]|nr:TIGR02301 family protein [Hyphomicrobiaceae bacterium]
MRTRAAVLALGLLACVWLSAVAQAQAPPPTLASPENRPYDDKLLRLSEILGAVHYLRELCGSNDGQLWRDRMKDLMNAEGSSALRRAKLTRSFNDGYRSYSRTYYSCTASAQTAIQRFLTEGAEIADALVKTVP